MSNSSQCEDIGGQKLHHQGVSFNTKIIGLVRNHNHGGVVRHVLHWAQELFTLFELPFSLPGV